MKLVHGTRTSGKTTRAVEIANEENAYLVVPTKHEATRVYHNYDLDRFPITYGEVLHGKHEGQHPQQVVIDNIEMFIARASNLRPVAGTLTTDGIEEL